MQSQIIAGPGSGHRSFADFYKSSAYSQFPQEHRSHPKSCFSAFVVDQKAHDFTDIASSDWVLGLPLRAACPTRFNYGDGWRQQQRNRGDFLLVPPGTEVRYEIAGPTRLLVLTWASGVMTDLDAELFADEKAALGPLIGRYFKNNSIEYVCRAIWIEMVRSDDASRLFLDSALSQLGGTLLRCAAKQTEKVAHRRIEIRRVLGFIEENLTRDLSLKDLSDVAGLSLFHFAREFHSQVGDSPYRFLQKKRAERALSLMARKELSGEDVARQSGFASVRAMRAGISRHGAQWGARPTRGGGEEGGEP